MFKKIIKKKKKKNTQQYLLYMYTPEKKQARSQLRPSWNRIPVEI